MTLKSWLVSIGVVALSVASSAIAVAETKAEIDTSVDAAVQQFYEQRPANAELASKAAGMLVFPRVTKGGAGVAGEYGEGVLRIGDRNVKYYSVEGASVGLTVGVAQHSEIILFMTQEALNKFAKSKGWTIGADTEVAVLSVGAGGAYDTETLKKPVLGFIFNEKGLIGDVSLAGTKITRIDREG